MTQSDGGKKYTLLEAAVKLAPDIKQLVPLDCSISVADREKFLVDYPSESLQLMDNTGKKIPKESGLYKAIQTGETQRRILPEKVYGVPFRSVTVPIKEDREVIGGFGLGLSLYYQQTLAQAAQSFKSTSENVLSSTEELSASAQELAAGMEVLDTLKNEMEEQVDKTEVILNFIKKVAANSNLLGLNAAIEAARVGEAGHGFEVVATEIRKMAENSAKSVEEVEEIVDNIKLKVARINEEITRILEISRYQAISTQEINTSLQGLSEYVDKIEDVAQKF